MGIGSHLMAVFKILVAVLVTKVYSLEEALASIDKDINSFTGEVERKAKQEVQALAAQAHAMITEKAQSRLRSTRKIYTDNLDIQKIQSDSHNEIWSVVLYKPAKWIEEGQPPHEMIDQLLGSQSMVKKGSNTGKPWVKHGKNGRYAAVPFEHSKPASQMSLAQNKLANYVKRELANRGLDKMITKDGKPVLGKAATVNLNGPNAPIRKNNKQVLAGINIYQREIKTKTGKSMIKRDVVSFRMVSDSQKGTGDWQHHGRAPASFFEETSKELDVIWEKLVQKIVSET